MLYVGFFFFSPVSQVSTRGGNHLAWFVSRDTVSIQHTSLNALYQHDESVAFDSQQKAGRTPNTNHRPDAKCSQGQDHLDIWICSAHAHINPVFFIFFSICGSAFSAYFNEMNSLVCFFLKGPCSLLFVEYCCVFMIKTCTERSYRFNE